MSKKSKSGSDPVMGAMTDGTYGELSTPLNAPKADPDPQAQLENNIIPFATGADHHDPMGYLDLTGERGRRGDPDVVHGTTGQKGIRKAPRG